MTTQQPALTLQDIADLAAVQRPVVSMWRRRPRARGRVVPFPAPIAVIDGAERFDRGAVVAWLEETGRGNNTEARQDAPGLSVPDGASVEDAVTLLCLHVLTGADLAGVTAARLTAMAQRVDPQDRYLLREVRAMGEMPAIQHFLDDLVEASYGAPDALERLERGRLRRLAPQFGLTDDLGGVLAAVVDAARTHLGGDDVALAPPADAALTRRLAPGFAGVLIQGDDSSSRARRRRALIAGADLIERARATVRVLSVLGDPEVDALETVDELVLALSRDDIGIVLGPASILSDRLGGDPEQRRAQTLRGRTLALAVRLPRGQWKAAPRQALAMCVFNGGLDSGTFWATDLDGQQVDLTDLTSDTAAALRASVDRAYRYARPSDLATVLAGDPVVPRGARAVRLGTAGDTSYLDRIHAASLITSEPLPGYDLTASPAPGRVVLRRRSLGELVSAQQLQMKRGTRVDLSLVQAGGTVHVLTASGSEATAGLDAFDAARAFPRAARTEPGDVIFTERPRPTARVDQAGGALVASPSRILRLREGAPVGPHLLAAIINALPDGSGDWQGWSVPDLPSAAAQMIESSIAAAAAHLVLLHRRERALTDLVANLVQGVAAGAVAVEPITAQEEAG